MFLVSSDTNDSMQKIVIMKCHAKISQPKTTSEKKVLKLLFEKKKEVLNHVEQS